MNQKEPMITAQGVTVRYGEHMAVKDVDLALIPGTVTALMGPNGAGKTTLLKVISGLETPTAGDVSVAGHGPVHLLDRGLLARTIALMLRPPEIPFAWYGTRTVVARKAGHVPIRLSVELDPPWWQLFPVGLFTDLLWPGTLEDVHSADTLVLRRREAIKPAARVEAAARQFKAGEARRPR